METEVLTSTSPLADHPTLRDELRAIRAAYFSNPDRRRLLRQGETLMRQDEPNRRLYLILRGTVSAWARDSDGKTYALFKATTNMFVGVYSLFSRTYKSLTHIIADEDTELAYLDVDALEAADPAGTPLYERLMPIVVAELVNRHQRTKELLAERERALEKLIESEKMASLGQMAAGIAHELNNAVAVLDRNTDWLSKRLGTYLTEERPAYVPFYQEGLQQGRRRSSREIRHQTQTLQKRLRCSREVARKMAEACFPDDTPVNDLTTLTREVDTGHRYWEFGAVFHDMRLAARHATHVVHSMKVLGAQHAPRRPGVDINESIHESMALLRSQLRPISVNLMLGVLPTITASTGELVQMWTNLIKNACESMQQASTTAPELTIRTKAENAHIHVEIADNGPGIPTDVLPRIFQPNVTTKVGGLSFGLGLGLTIVDRLVNDYDGTIRVDSIPGRTVFSVELPTV